MNAASPAVAFLAKVQEHLRRTKRTQNRLAFLSYGLAFFLVLFLVDVWHPLAAWVRGSFLLIGICGGIVLRSQLRKRAAVPEVPAQTLARTIENRFPHTDNALIHGVQFSDAAVALPDASREFIAREHQRARDEAKRIPIRKSVPLPAYNRTRLLFALLVIAWIGLIGAFPRMHRFEIPRFVALWKETPPYSPTDFLLNPEYAEVKSGANVTITVKVSGVLPHTLNLVTQTEANSPQNVSMTDKGGQTYTVTLENLTADTSFYAMGDTGRSQTGKIHILAEEKQTKSQAESRASEMFERKSGQTKQTTPQEAEDAKFSGKTGTGYGDRQPPPPPKTYSIEQVQAEKVKAKQTPIILKGAGDITRFPPNYRRLLQDYFRPRN